MVLFFIGCSTINRVQYIPIEKTKTEYISKVDTTIIKDSIFVDRFIKADTVFLTKDRYKYIEKIKRDTLYRVDSIPIIKEVKIEVPVVPNYYKKINKYFWILLILVIVFGGYKIHKIFRIF